MGSVRLAHPRRNSAPRDPNWRARVAEEKGAELRIWLEPEPLLRYLFPALRYCAGFTQSQSKRGKCPTTSTSSNSSSILLLCRQFNPGPRRRSTPTARARSSRLMFVPFPLLFAPPRPLPAPLRPHHHRIVPSHAASERPHWDTPANKHILNSPSSRMTPKATLGRRSSVRGEESRPD